MIDELDDMVQGRRGATWNSERQVLSCKDLKAFARAIMKARARRMERLLVMSKHDGTHCHQSYSQTWGRPEESV